jgi:pilus assembly protein CpaB
MLATRQGALILALLCAACAAGILVMALSSYKKSVQTTVKQATVLVATGEIPKGTTGDNIATERLYKSTPIVATQLQAGAISDATGLVGQVATSDILPGQQLTTADFGVTVGAASLLQPNQRALSIPADEIHADLGILNPGDRVDLYEENNVKQPDGNTQIQIALLDDNVLVLKTPGSGLAGSVATASASTSSSKPAAANGSLVVALKSSQVPAVSLTADNGTLWLALRPANAAGTTGGIVTGQTVLAQAQAEANAVAAQNKNNAKNNTTGTHK